MILRVAFAGIACAACLSPPDEAVRAVDAAPGGRDAAAARDASSGCSVFADEFERKDLGEAWQFYGDPSDVVHEIQDGALYLEAFGDGAYRFTSEHTLVDWTVSATELVVELDAAPASDGDVFVGWLDLDTFNYVGLDGGNGGTLSVVSGVLGLPDWDMLCPCPELAPELRVWRIRPDGDTLVFEVSGGGEWLQVGPTMARPFERAAVMVWAEANVGLTSTSTIERVAANECPP